MVFTFSNCHIPQLSSILFSNFPVSKYLDFLSDQNSLTVKCSPIFPVQVGDMSNNAVIANM